MSKKVLKNCRMCDVVFENYKSQNKKFCSKECFQSYGFVFLEKEELLRLYIGLELTMKQIADFLGTSPSTVRFKLKKYSIPTRKQSYQKRQNVDMTLIKDLYLNQFFTAKEIAVEIGCSQDVVLYRLHELGIVRFRTKWDYYYRNRKKIIEGELRYLYFKKKMSVCEIAKLYGVHVVTINKYFRKFKIQLKGKVNLTKKELVELYINQEKSAYDIIKMIGKKDPHIVTDRLRKYNIPVRSMSEAGKISITKNNKLEKWRKSSSLKPNKKEKFLIKLLNEVLLNEYKYVGDFSFILGGRNPDFMNINGQKKLIEFFGEHWHYGKFKKNNPNITKKEIENERRNYFKSFGFNTLIIWENELENIELLSKKIKIFNEVSCV